MCVCVCVCVREREREKEREREREREREGGGKNYLRREINITQVENVITRPIISEVN